METQIRIDGQSQSIESWPSNVRGKFKERLAAIALSSAPVFLVILEACTVSGKTDASLANLNVYGDNVLTIADVCKKENYALKACYDIDGDGALTDADSVRERKFIGTTPILNYDLTGDDVSTCDDLVKEEGFIALHKGEQVESTVRGVSTHDLEEGISLDHIEIYVKPDTSDDTVQQILDKHNLLEIDTQGNKNYGTVDLPRNPDRKLVFLRIPDNIWKAPGFDIAQLKENLSQADGVNDVEYSIGGLKPAVTLGTPQTCPS